MTVFAKENGETRALNEKLKEKKMRRQVKEQGQEEEKGRELRIESKSVLTWEGLCYDVPAPGGGGEKLRLLKDIYGFVRPGQLTALMYVLSPPPLTSLQETIHPRQPPAKKQQQQYE